jgi:hypothetical protein
VNETVPRRASIVFVALVVATAATFVLGTDEPFGTGGARLAAGAAIVIAFVKVAFVGLDFMELRGANRTLRRVFALWLVVVGLGSLVLYLA